MHYGHNPQRAYAQDRRSGFTLAELIVVLSILAVMALSVSPIFRGALRDARAEHAVSDFVAVLNYAPSRAITDSVEYRVYVDAEARTYRLLRAAGPATYPPAFERMPGRYQDDVALPPSLHIGKIRMRREVSTKDYYVAFFPNGATDIAEIEFSTDADDSASYTVSVTGVGVQTGVTP